jgi:hypothetical protein
VTGIRYFFKNNQKRALIRPKKELAVRSAPQACDIHCANKSKTTIPAATAAGIVVFAGK